LIEWLWFAIGRSHVSDRLSRPRIEEENCRCKKQGKLFWLKIMRN